MDEKLVLLQSVTPDVVYKVGDRVTVNITLTNAGNISLTDVVLKSSCDECLELVSFESSKEVKRSDIAKGIVFSSLEAGETVEVSYELEVVSIDTKRVVIATTAEILCETQTATSTIYFSPFTRYATAQASICTEDIGCVEEIFVEKEAVRFAPNCDDILVTVGLFIGIRYETCEGKNKTARRYETVSFLVPSEYFNPDALSVSVQKICTSCREYAQCVTCYLRVDFGN